MSTHDPLINRAFRDLLGIYDWIAVDNETAAAKQVQLIQASISQLARFPESGRKARTRDNRELVVPGTPYIVRYYPMLDVVLIISIKHGAQRG